MRGGRAREPIARADCARGPSLPSMLTGSPSTKPAALRSAASFSRRAASAEKFLRAIVSTPAASRRSGSLAATPMVLLPRSRPISAPRAGKSAAASMSGRIGMAAAYHAPCRRPNRPGAAVARAAVNRRQCATRGRSRLVGPGRSAQDEKQEKKDDRQCEAEDEDAPLPGFAQNDLAAASLLGGVGSRLSVPDQLRPP